MLMLDVTYSLWEGEWPAWRGMAGCNEGDERRTKRTDIRGDCGHAKTLAFSDSSPKVEGINVKKSYGS